MKLRFTHKSESKDHHVHSFIKHPNSHSGLEILTLKIFLNILSLKNLLLLFPTWLPRLLRHKALLFSLASFLHIDRIIFPEVRTCLPLILKKKKNPMPS